MNDGRDAEKITTQVTWDRIYSFQWECIILKVTVQVGVDETQFDSPFKKVENILFRIPRYLLLKHSQHLKELFNAHPATEANPFIVDNTTVAEFRHFLRIILPSVTEKLETLWTNKHTVSKDEWISVLKISTLWLCLNLRKLAIHELEYSYRLTKTSSFVSTLNPTEKIVLGRRYSISSWVEAGYTGMVRNGEITDRDMEEIGGVESFKLMRIINNIQKQPNVASTLDTTIAETFHAELMSIAAAEQAYLPLNVEGSQKIESSTNGHKKVQL